MVTEYNLSIQRQSKEAISMARDMVFIVMNYIMDKRSVDDELE